MGIALRRSLFDPLPAPPVPLLCAPEFNLIFLPLPGTPQPLKYTIVLGWYAGPLPSSRHRDIFPAASPKSAGICLF